MNTEPRRVLDPTRAERCELVQAVAMAVAQAFGLGQHLQRVGLVVDEAMREFEKED